MENILLIYKICSQLSGKCPDSCGSWLFSCLVLSRENKKIKFMNLDGWDSKPHGFFLSELLLICRFSILKPLPHDMRHMICLCQWPTYTDDLFLGKLTDNSFLLSHNSYPTNKGIKVCPVGADIDQRLTAVKVFKPVTFGSLFYLKQGAIGQNFWENLLRYFL